jgi:hypothetical protein
MNASAGHAFTCAAIRERTWRSGSPVFRPPAVLAIGASLDIIYWTSSK